MLDPGVVTSKHLETATVGTKNLDPGTVGY